jgi:hypothetical protein
MITIGLKNPKKYILRKKNDSGLRTEKSMLFSIKQPWKKKAYRMDL